MTQQRSILTVRLTDKRTGAIRKINGREWISAGHCANLQRNGTLDRDAYDIEYRRVEVK